MFSWWFLIINYFGFLCRVVVRFYYISEERTASIFRVTENLGSFWLRTIIYPPPTFGICNCRKPRQPLYITATFPSSLSPQHKL